MELREEFAHLKAEVLKVIEAAKSENRDLTAEENEANEKRFARIDGIQKILDTEKRAAQLAIEQNSDIKAAVTQSFAASKPSVKVVDNDRVHLDALNHFARTGQLAEQFHVTTGTAAGALLPKSIPGYSEVLRPSNAFRIGYAAAGGRVMTTDSTEPVKLPVFDDTASYAKNDGEGATSETVLDATIGSTVVDLDVNEYNGKSMWFSNNIVRAQSFNVLDLAVPYLSKRIDLQEEIDWATDIKTATLGANTVSTSGIQHEDIKNFVRSLPLAYRQSKNGLFIVCHPDLVDALVNLEDGENRPLISEALVSGEPNKMFGVPYVESEALEGFGANKVLAAIISIEGYYIRNAGGKVLARYENYPLKPNSVGFNMFSWSAAGFNAAAVRTLKTPAS